MKLRFLSLVMLVVLALSVVVPTFAQDSEMPMTDNMSMSDDGLLTYSAESCDYGGQILSIEAVDATTVRFTFCYSDPAFPSKAAFSSFQIYPSEYLVATGGGGPELFQNPVGTGPFQLEAWNLGDSIVLSRNENYWGEPAQEQTAIFRWNAEAAARLNELRAGTVDGIDNADSGPTRDYADVTADANLRLYDRPPLNVFYLGMNNTVPPFDNPLVRQAVAHAIDKQRIIDNYYPTGSLVATQFMPPAIFGFTEEVEPFPYDPERARELLAEAGVELPIETTISYRDVVRGYLPTPGIVAQDLQAQLAEVGINVTIDLQESGTFLDNADAGALSLHLLGWGADYPDATNFLDFHFGAGASDQFGDKFEEITTPLAAAAALSNPDERYALYVDANTAIRDLAPMLPVAHGASAVVFEANIEGAHASPLGNEALAVMSDPDDDDIIFMQNGEPAGLYCADETDGEALRVCEQIGEPLLAYEIAGTEVIPALATEFSANEDATEYTFTLREGVTFHDGSTFDANDVVLSWAVQWDAAHPLHVGRDGNFTYFSAFFGGFLNAPTE